MFDIEASFSHEALDILLNSAGGYPWIVHILAQEALKACWDNGRTKVNREDMQDAVRSLAGNRFAQQYSDCYQAAVRDSPQREIVLRLMAKWPDDDVPLSEIYRIAKSMEISNPYKSKADLMLKRHGEVLVIPPMHKTGVIRFRDSMFKKYINLRSSIYNSVQQNVDEAWENR